MGVLLTKIEIALTKHWVTVSWVWSALMYTVIHAALLKGVGMLLGNSSLASG